MFHCTGTDAQLGTDQHQPPHTKSSNLVHTPSHHKGVREVSLVHSDSQDGEDFLEEIDISIQFLRKRGNWLLCLSGLNREWKSPPRHTGCVCQGSKHINSLLLVNPIFNTLPQKISILRGNESGAQEFRNTSPR